MTTQITPKKRASLQRKRRVEEARWVAQSGKVITRRIGDPKVDPPPPDISGALGRTAVGPQPTA
jgi:hypothetical protein